MTDIVKRLNAPPVANHYYSPGQPLEGAVLTERREAAAEIERLRAENKRLTEENERLDAEIYSLYYAQSMADRYA